MIFKHVPTAMETFIAVKAVSLLNIVRIVLFTAETQFVYKSCFVYIYFNAG